MRIIAWGARKDRSSAERLARRRPRLRRARPSSTPTDGRSRRARIAAARWASTGAGACTQAGTLRASRRARISTSPPRKTAADSARRGDCTRRPRRFRTTRAWRWTGRDGPSSCGRTRRRCAGGSCCATRPDGGRTLSPIHTLSTAVKAWEPDIAVGRDGSFVVALARGAVPVREDRGPGRPPRPRAREMSAARRQLMKPHLLRGRRRAPLLRRGRRSGPPAHRATPVTARRRKPGGPPRASAWTRSTRQAECRRAGASPCPRATRQQGGRFVRGLQRLQCLPRDQGRAVSAQAGGDGHGGAGSHGHGPASSDGVLRRIPRQPERRADRWSGLCRGRRTLHHAGHARHDAGPAHRPRRVPEEPGRPTWATRTASRASRSRVATA